MVGDGTPLGDRMKRLEAATRAVLPRRCYTICRVDIRAAHSYLRGADRPYDYAFMADMDATAAALCQEISGAVFAYTQSDEISVLVTDFGSLTTEPWFGGVVQKVCSIAAATATLALNARRPAGPGGGAMFDARVFPITDPVEVANYFIWRQRDAVRNSITMAAQSVFSHKRLEGVNGDQKQELLLAEAGINWNDYPDGAKRGRVAVRKSGEREVTFTHKRTGAEQTVSAVRSWWETGPAPHFTVQDNGFLAETIPPMPMPSPRDGSHDRLGADSALPGPAA